MTKISLRDFVSASLAEIAQGVTDANLALQDPEAEKWSPFMLASTKGDKPNGKAICFDISVAATESKTQKGGFAIALVNLGAGASAERGHGNEASHRIQFEIGISERWV